MTEPLRPLPPERTVGQLVAETIRFYQESFWQVLPLGLALAAIEQVTPGTRRRRRRSMLAAGAPLMTAAYVRACDARRRRARGAGRRSRSGTLIFLPVPLLMRVYLLPAARVARVRRARRPGRDRSSGSASAARSSAAGELGTADYVHSLGGIATLAIVFGLTQGRRSCCC